MTTLNTIIEEEKKEFDKQYGGQRFVYANELTMQDFLATAMQRAYEAGANNERASWLRSEIKKLKWMEIETDSLVPIDNYEHPEYDQAIGFNQAITSIITRYKEELKVLEGK